MGREFDTEGEAFAYAESRRNKAAEAGWPLPIVPARWDSAWSAMCEAATSRRQVTCYADSAVYDDRRQISGEPVAGRADIRAAIKRITEQFQHFEFQTLAVRGERFCPHPLVGHGRKRDGRTCSCRGLMRTAIVYDGRFDGTTSKAPAWRWSAGTSMLWASLMPMRCGTDASPPRGNPGDLDSAFAMFAAPGLRIE